MQVANSCTDLTVATEALATSEPGAVATGQKLTFKLPTTIAYYMDNATRISLSVWPVATAPGSDVTWRSLDHTAPQPRETAQLDN